MRFIPLCALLLSSSKRVSAFAPTQTKSFLRTMSTSLSAKPFSVVVQAEIKPDRMDEFLEMIEANAVASRKEPGCLRFDVLQAQDDPNKFIFYEMYENTAAVDFHKTQPHYQKWADFKESGGTVSSVSHKMDGLFVP